LCPSEWTTREVNAIIKKYMTRKRPGRKPIGERAMTDAERQRRHRKKELVSSPPLSPEMTNANQRDDVRARSEKVDAPANAKTDRETT
jgi:hypothetical protein